MSAILIYEHQERIQLRRGSNYELTRIGDVGAQATSFRSLVMVRMQINRLLTGINYGIITYLLFTSARGPYIGHLEIMRS